MGSFLLSTVLAFVLVSGWATAQAQTLSPDLLALLSSGDSSLVDVLLGRGRYRSATSKPNVILLLADDMGVGDLTSYGHPVQEPGYIDEMAAAGLRFTNGYVGDAVCTPSRSSIMTGRLPVRIGTYGETRVFLPWTKTGLPKDEVTIAEVMQQAGYATGMVGKWHLGINENSTSDGAHLPFNHGFDFVGHILPFTNSWACDDTGLHLDFPETEKCYLYYNATLLTQPYQHKGLTQSFTQDAIGFIEDNADNSFFLYVAFAHMHTSLFSSDEFACTSRRGRYGDNLLEMHDAVRQIIEKLEELQISDNTIVFFISDHGPHREYCLEGGDAHIFRGGKSHAWEGGHRIPYIVYWPGTITPGISNEIVTSMDVIATAADFAGSALPTDRVYDGKSIKDVLLEGEASPHDAFFYYCKDTMMAVRVGKYKAHFKTQRVRSQSEYGERCDSGFPVEDYFDCNECEGDCITEHDPPLLFDLFKDPGEAYPITSCPATEDIFASIREAVRAHKVDLVKGTPLLDEWDMSIVPCCNPDTNCVCNYEHEPGVPECYSDLMTISAKHYTP